MNRTMALSAVLCLSLLWPNTAAAITKSVNGLGSALVVAARWKLESRSVVFA